MDDRPWTVDDWTGCYPSNWKGVIVEEAMAHPAKFSSKLIRRIYKHLSEMGWVKEGDSVLDPFGGVALGAFDALRLGLTWYGVELEERFWKIGNQNIALWDSLYEDMPKWGRAKLLRGDSRELLKVLDFENWVTVQGGVPGITCQVSSPPFLQSDGGTPEPKPGGVIDRAMYERHAAGNHKAGGYGRTDGQLHHMREGGFDAAISSPPFQTDGEGSPLDTEKYPTLRGVLKTNAAGLQKYGDTDGQLANMKAAVSSPPYGDGFSNNAGGHGESFTPAGGGEIMPRLYGETEGQLGKMKGDFDAAVSSPPYENTNVGNGDGEKELQRQVYLANADDFWQAGREIVEQVYQCLTPGGHAVWVVKDYVKSKQVVPFCDQWRQLCEAVGFETLHEHHAMLVHGRQMTLEGGVHVRESKSFFRRIAEKNGSPRIDYEVVYCMVKGR